MLKHVVAAVVSAALMAAPVSAMAQALQPPATEPAAKPAEVKKKAVPAGLAAARERQKKCGAEWKEAKAGGKVAKGVTWPKYWSACNKRLKAQGAAPA